MDGAEKGNWTYSEYLNLRELLELQGEDRGISSDEMHFIIVHQTFELWFKQIIRELLRPEISSVRKMFRKMISRWLLIIYAGQRKSSD